MQVLKRASGARPPRVVLDPSLSMSVQLPAGLRVAKRAVETTSVAAPIATNPTPREAPSRDDDESWETRSDWSAATPAAACDSTATRRVVDTSMAVWSTEQLPVEGEWEDADAPELPDDFPLLIVNLSRLRDLHFRSESSSYAIAMDTDEQLREFYATVKHTLHEHFTQMTEVLFDQEVCFHTHYGAQRRMLENLHRAFPSDVFALIDYPTQLAGLELHEYLHVLATPTRWASINYLKDCLRKCSRDLEWKFEIAIELEKLAQQEHDWWTTEQQRRSDEIDALTRLRDSFRDKLQAGDSKHANSYLLLRKLEDIETRVVTLIDVFLKEPELTPRESRELMGFMDAEPSMQMRNVLDMVVAMIFSRLPRDYGSQPTKEAHFEMLLDHHLHIRRLWKKDFGRLPARAGGADEAELEEELEHVDELSEIGETKTNLEHDFDQFCQVGDKEHVDPDELDDDWEAIASDDDKDEDDTHVEKDPLEPIQTESKPVADGLDGYGADFDSDESASESEGEVESVPPIPVKRVARRTRRKKKTRDAAASTTLRDRSPSPVDRIASPSERDRALEAFMYGDGDSDSGSGGEIGGGRLAQPFARTGALQLLRRAKESEGF